MLSRKKGMRFRSALNWLLLGLNILLLTVLFFRGLLPSVPSAARTRRDATTLGMDTYVNKGPFGIFVNKDFPQNESFTFLAHGYALSLSSTDEEGAGSNRKSVSVVLGPDFSFSCEYSVDQQGSLLQVDDFWLEKKDESFVDYNIDGVFDARISVDTDYLGSVEIWYQGNWCETIADSKGDKYHKRLKEGQSVYFDLKSGLWILETEKETGVVGKKKLSETNK